jgi:AcrR family transcriptional regulator
MPAYPTLGRPRRFDDETERRLLVDAAVRVLERRGRADLSVSEVLREAGLSTGAFYRHFESKEALLEYFIVEEARFVGRSLQTVVDRAPDPRSALDAWLERFLDVFYERRQARRTALVASITAVTTRPSAEMMRETRAIVCQSLIKVLRDGHAAGVLSSPFPESDAYTVHDLVIIRRSASTDDVPARSAMLAYVKRFAWPGLGL